MKIELNKEEAAALLTLIDMAVKANGLNVAMAGLSLANKINEAAKAEKESE